ASPRAACARRHRSAPAGRRCPARARRRGWWPRFLRACAIRSLPRRGLRGAAGGKGAGQRDPLPRWQLEFSNRQILRGEAPGGKARAEAAALAGLALDLEAGLMARERVLGDGEAEAGAAGLARAAAVDPIEALGEPRDVLGLDADAGVLDAEARAVVRLAPGERDRAARRGVADGVAHQVAERAGELGFHAQQVAGRFDLGPDRVFSAGKRFGIGPQPLQERLYRYALVGGRRRRRIERRKREQVLDDALHARSLVLHHPDVVA